MCRIINACGQQLVYQYGFASMIVKLEKPSFLSVVTSLALLNIYCQLLHAINILWIQVPVAMLMKKSYHKTLWWLEDMRLVFQLYRLWNWQVPWEWCRCDGGQISERQNTHKPHDFEAVRHLMIRLLTGLLNGSTNCNMYRKTSNIICRLLRCSWSIACRRCTNYIFILNYTPGFSILHKGDCKTRRATFKFWNIRDFTLYVDSVIKIYTIH